MSHRRILMISCLLAPIASLALARIHPFGNAELNKRAGIGISINDASGLPKEARSILTEKCGDCHSNNQTAPLYRRFAPISWLLERDVTEARKAMNLSDWNSYQPDKKQLILAQIIHEAKSGEMPPLQYRMIHWGARISASDLKVLARLTREAGKGDASSAPGDPARGKRLFEKSCTGCHALGANHEGPRLQGVYGRSSGSIPDFAYSPALKGAHIAWDETALEKWLTDPDALIPGNEMDFLVSAPRDRTDLISYLRQNSGK